MRSGRRILLTDEATDDLRDIIQYTTERWGREQATAYKTLIDQGLNRIARFPTLGAVIDDSAAVVRWHLAGSHVIHYSGDGDSVTILRILHVRRDIAAMFDE